MKTLTIKNTLKSQFITAAMLGLTLLISACGEVLKPGFDGTYVNSAGSEFSAANDTLVIELAQGNQYLIHRRTGFRLLDEHGKPGKLQQEKEEWTAVYDPKSEVLTEKRHGKTITFNSDRTEITVVRRKYQRIN